MPGAASSIFERDVTLDPGWLRELSPGSPHRPDHLIWPMVLNPELVVAGWRYPEETLEVSRHLRWRGPPPTMFRGRVDVEWVTPYESGSAIALRTTASAGGRLLASSTTVIKVRDVLPAMGRRILEPPPDVRSKRLRGVAISEHEVIEFSRLLQATYELHSVPARAQRVGFRNMLVQGTLLLRLINQEAHPPATGSVDAWFRRPVTVGAALHLGRSVDDPTIWSLSAVATGATATVVRYSACNRSTIAPSHGEAR